MSVFFQLRMSKDLRAALKSSAKKDGMTASDLVRKICREHLLSREDLSKTSRKKIEET